MAESQRAETPDLRPMHEQPRWRRDFPIDASDDHLVARRDFTRFLVLTSLAFAIGQLWIGFRSLVRRSRPAPGELRLIALDALPPGRAQTFSYQGSGALLLRLRSGELTAFDSECTHLACGVVPELDQDRLACPCHHGYFDAASGRPIAGPPQRPLPRIHLEVRDGWIWATKRELRT